MNIPLPGPFSYSVGAPKVGRAVNRAAKTLAKDTRKRREARYTQPAPRPQCTAASQQAANDSGANDSGAAVGITRVLVLLTLLVLVILAFGGFRL